MDASFHFLNRFNGLFHFVFLCAGLNMKKELQSRLYQPLYNKAVIKDVNFSFEVQHTFIKIFPDYFSCSVFCFVIILIGALQRALNMKKTNENSIFVFQWLISKIWITGWTQIGQDKLSSNMTVTRASLGPYAIIMKPLGFVLTSMSCLSAPTFQPHWLAS